MSMKQLLEQAGYITEPQTGVWMRPGFAGIDYSDGDEVEQRLARIIAEASDLTVLSDELKQQISDWPSLYHLSSSRANLMRPFAERLAGARVLEIGAGCGAITRYLAEAGAQVLALEGSGRRAAIARSRTRDLPAVEVLAERFDAFACDAQFDVVTLIGVLEYANQFVPGEDPALAMLRRARALLKPGGVLLLAIENQLGLKYWAGAPEDHLGVPMYGIEGRYRSDQPQTFGRLSLARLLEQAGFPLLDLLSPLPDYKLPVSIVTAAGLDDPGFDAAALASQSARRDPQLPPTISFAPELAWPAVMENDLGADLANSFLIMARSPEAPAPDPAVLAYHFSTERRQRFCKQTVFRREPDGQIGVHYGLLAPDSPSAPGGILLSFQLPDSAHYVPGETLASEFIRLVTRDGWTIEAVGEFLRRYLDALGPIVYDGKPMPALTGLEQRLPGTCFDLVPQNIIRDPGDRCQGFDLEWRLVEGMPLGWLLFRTLLLLVHGVTWFGSPGSSFVANRRGFFLAAIRSAGFEVNAQALESFAALEMAAQVEVTGRSTQALSNWWADSPLPMRHRLDQTERAVQEQVHRALRAEEALVASEEALQASKDVSAALRRELEQLHQVTREQIDQRNRQIVTLQESLQHMNASTSWRVTGPMRAASTAVARLQSKAQLGKNAIRFGGGLIPTLRTTADVLRKEGLGGIRWRLGYVQGLQNGAAPAGPPAHDRSPLTRQLVPFYPNPLWDTEPPLAPEGVGRFALHCHLPASSDIAASLPWLKAIRIPFDLYLTVAGGCEADSLLARCRHDLVGAGQIRVRDLPAAAPPLTSMLVAFGDELATHAAVAHFDLSRPDGQRAMQSLVGPPEATGGRLARLLGLLERDAALVLSSEPEGVDSRDLPAAESKWVARVAKACQLDLDETPSDWPIRGAAAFLARGASLRAALPALSMPGGAIGDAAREACLSNALAAALPLFAAAQQGRALQLQAGDSSDDFRGYEGQRDYSGSVIHPDIKVLSYYLPQFHPTPENDEWHGKGFTEWTKVRAANPLFAGHYQQHIPHPDIGYYHLDSPDVLRRQAEQMRQAGVHGQVFYHYWFSGRMILEMPARMLLEHADIAMPFCFCWANENWTRRWDGNEREILLGQTYSADDARAFIRYLIPFFQDPRYIRVGERPVLMVYRPSSIPDPDQYIDIWREECAQVGLEAPYVMAVLTRGATDPAHFRMDAGVERPLHDWTDGVVPDLRPELQRYWPMNGSALSYDGVREFYTARNGPWPFVHIRSNVPMWDNTARYGSDALVVHGSTPQSFQQWMEHSISDVQAHLPPALRFIVVNAWNEWAEGCHLEPDTRHGYSYLNGVGRALSGLSYGHELNASAPIPDGLRLEVRFSRELIEQLQTDAFVRRRFFHCLAQSRLLRERGVCIDYFEHEAELPLARSDAAGAEGELRLEIRRAVCFAPDVIENMVQTALATQAVVIGNDYGRRLPAQDITDNGAVPGSESRHASLLVRPRITRDSLARDCRMRSDAWTFELQPGDAGTGEWPRVTTILRFHKRARLEDLRRALSCLYVMRHCVVIPLIAAQDLDADQTAALEALLRTFDWPAGGEPIIEHYASSDGHGDLRSRMLNESLRKVRTQYAAFLDYDDLLFADAYAWQIQRLRATGKAIAFGRVYWTDYRSQIHALVQRRRAFEYGGSHEEFVQNNHAPLHSVLLDVTQLDLSKLVYFDDQRYMEDYLMTLQLFTKDNGDWQGLRKNFYVGDYVHSVDRPHTLALIDDEVRASLLEDPEYRLCEERIETMRKRIS